MVQRRLELGSPAQARSGLNYSQDQMVHATSAVLVYIITMKIIREGIRGALNPQESMVACQIKECPCPLHNQTYQFGYSQLPSRSCRDG